MPDDPRIKRVLKRYRKGEDLPDAAIDITAMGAAQLLWAFSADNPDFLTAPKELNYHTLSKLSTIMAMEFDREQFDYYVHSYVRREFLEDFFSDPSITFKPAPENGPPSKIPLAKGLHWVSVRPRDGEETWDAYEIDDSPVSAPDSKT